MVFNSFYASNGAYMCMKHFYCEILFEILEVAERHMSFIGWNFYLLFVCCMVAERMAFRDHYRLNGSPAEDAFIVTVFFLITVLASTGRTFFMEY